MSEVFFFEGQAPDIISGLIEDIVRRQSFSHIEHDMMISFMIQAFYYLVEKGIITFKPAQKVKDANFAL